MREFFHGWRRNAVCVALVIIVSLCFARYRPAEVGPVKHRVQPKATDGGTEQLLQLLDALDIRGKPYIGAKSLIDERSASWVEWSDVTHASKLPSWIDRDRAYSVKKMQTRQMREDESAVYVVIGVVDSREVVEDWKESRSLRLSDSLEATEATTNRE